MNILYLNLFQFSFITLFFIDCDIVAGQFFVNETQDIGFSSKFSKNSYINLLQVRQNIYLLILVLTVATINQAESSRQMRGVKIPRL